MCKLLINYSNLDNFCRINDFVLINKNEIKKENIYLNFVYSTENNFLNEAIYPKDMPLIINKDIWEKLKKLNNDLKKYKLCITICDAYRPITIQRIFWEKFYIQHGFHDEDLVADPNKYGTHNIKINAIDIIPCSLDGSKIELPCEFDDFTGKAHINYNGCSTEAKKNRDLLIKLAKNNGLLVNKSEWWHYYDERLILNKLNYIESNLIPKETSETFILKKTN